VNVLALVRVMLHTSPRREEHKVDQQQQSRWRPTRGQLLWAVGIAAVLAAAVLVGYRYHITLWDWIKLLVVPVVIAGGGIWFNRQQRERELEIAEQRAQDEALQAYLDGMAQLLTDKERPLHRAQPGDNLSSVARARTLTVLPRLDAERKARVAQFLYESSLINKERPALDLSGGNLGSGADLSGARLTRATLEDADLSGVNLQSANLSDANLMGANLTETELIRANLSRAILNTDFRARYTGETDLSRAHLTRANLMGADLGGVNLEGAKLQYVNLSETNLQGANLESADLSYADLSGDAGITNEELEQQTSSLEGATMPNGQKYEDWLKDREKRQQDE
jgi:uncharacterized protein YjbI with pentapeptide repeats